MPRRTSPDTATGAIAWTATTRADIARTNKARPDACEFCGRELDPGGHVDVVVPDSIYLHPDDRALDGQRPSRACAPEHADELIKHGFRIWIDEQLWIQKLSLANVPKTPREQLARQVGLTPAQVSRALVWHTATARHYANEQAPA